MRNIAQRTNNPEELYRILADKIKFEIRVAVPGIVQSFDPDEQIVTVQPAIRERVRDQNGVMQYVTLPLLMDVPVVFPRAGGYVLTMPISPGDECLIIFGDSCMDAWWSNGEIQNPIEKRRHDLSDGYAVMGVWSQPRRLSNYSTEAAELRTEDGQTFIRLKPGEVDINASSFKLPGGGINVLAPGQGVQLTSPDGNTIKTLTIDNQGNPVWS